MISLLSKNLCFSTVSNQGGCGLCPCQLWTIGSFSLCISISYRLAYTEQAARGRDEGNGKRGVGAGIQMYQSPKTGPSHNSDWLRVSCLVLQVLVHCASEESVLWRFFWAVYFSLAPWTAPLGCLDQNSVYTVLSVQPFNGAFIRCWINGFNVLSESWHVKLWHKVFSLAFSASQNWALTVMLWLQKSDRASLFLLHPTKNQNGAITCKKPGLGNTFQKQPFRPSALAWEQLDTWLLKDVLLSLIVYVHLFTRWL